VVGCVFYMGRARETGRGPYYDLVTKKINYIGYSERVNSVNLSSLLKHETMNGHVVFVPSSMSSSAFGSMYYHSAVLQTTHYVT
jgi:hypothetical protein